MSPGPDTTLTALAHGVRREVVETLATGPLSAGELAARLEVHPAALTRHLRALRRAGLVEVGLDAVDARRHIYTIRPEPMTELADWSRNIAQFWTTQLGSFERHVSDNAGW